jgi:adenylyltransferase/sulfurtransferase
LVPSCAEGGVFGVLPGIVGSIQALEAIKLAIGAGDTLVGRLLLFDALRLKFRELKLQKDPHCPICGTEPTIRSLIDYEAFCGIGSEPAHSAVEMTAHDLAVEMKQNPELLLIDVREPHEWEICHIEGARLLPLSVLPSRLNEIDGHKDIVLHCHHGVRSMRALEILRAAGFSKLRNLMGGIDAWAVNNDPEMPRY